MTADVSSSAMAESGKEIRRSPVTDAKQLRRYSRAGGLGFPTKRSLIEIGLEVGYKNPSHFAQVFRRVVGVKPTEFRSAL